MRFAEDDRDIKIPDWYMRLPQGVINKISDIGIVVNDIISPVVTRLVCGKRKEDKTPCNTVFYLEDR